MAEWFRNFCITSDRVFTQYNEKRTVKMPSQHLTKFSMILVFLSGVTFAILVTLTPRIWTSFPQLSNLNFANDKNISKLDNLSNNLKDLNIHITALTQSIKKQPPPPKNLELKAEALNCLTQAREMDSQGKHDKAIKLFEHALRLDPQHADILNMYGEFLETRVEDVVLAEHMYTKALMVSPSHSKALINRERTLPLVEEIDQMRFNRIDKKRDQLYKVPENDAGLRRTKKENYFKHVHHTTALEGNTMTLAQTRSIIENKMAIGGKSILEHNEIIGLDAALSFVNNSLVQRIGSITIDDILEIHKRVLGFVDPVEAGRFRSSQVYVGNHVPPQADEVRFYMEEFIQWLNSQEALDLHPIELAALAHYKLVFIHPFYDGNGRTSRLLMNLILMQAGYPPIIIEVEEKHLYYEYLETANAGDVRPFIRFIARITDDTLDEYLWSCVDRAARASSALSGRNPQIPFPDDGKTIIVEHEET